MWIRSSRDAEAHTKYDAEKGFSFFLENQRVSRLPWDEH